jgi:alpha-methylacyl-CoA racemase
VTILRASVSNGEAAVVEHQGSDGGGPLAGIRVVEFAGIGPGPMCAMLLADMGAKVLRIDRLEPSGLGLEKPTRFDVLNRGRRSAAINLKTADGVALARDVVANADVLIEGFRPGTMERIGLGPDDCFKCNERLVYGRVTGWGQDGPLAHAAGHDLNYIALNGTLDCIGRDGAPPTPPLNLVGDFGGGALFLAFGVTCALIEAKGSGRGQVVDAAMIDGAAILTSPFFGLRQAGLFTAERGTNLLDSGAPHYEVYRCADGRFVSVAPIERKFRAVLLDRLGIDAAAWPDFEDRSQWPRIKAMLADVFATRTRAQWCELLEGTDACFAPVLSLDEAPDHPHNRARGTFITVDGLRQPAPAPRFSRTKPRRPQPAEAPGASTHAALLDWGIDQKRVEQLARSGVIASTDIPEADIVRCETH